MPTTLPEFDESSLRKISSKRDLNIAKKKYMQFTKADLVNRLIAIEQQVAQNQKRWVASHFERFK